MMEITQKVPAQPSVSTQLTKSAESMPGNERVQKREQDKDQASVLPAKDKVETQVDSMNKLLEVNLTSLKFNLHEETDRYYVEVVDQKTKEVVKEIPPKEFLDLMARITEFTGILMDKKA
ncbi:flagellar protein FlaG [Cytobacillus firmus]|nr:flagellar protein FlaG [Cytobacillus firmus]